MDLFNDILGRLSCAAKGRNRRVSSNEQPNWNDGNFDMTPLDPGQRLELPVLRGPGVITHIWMTSHAGRAHELNSLSLRIYWDGRENPDVEVPMGDFFGVGQTPAPLESFPVQVSPTGSLSCYWRMPFSESARIVITNDNPDRRAGLYWQVDWIELDELPEDFGYFCAGYRQEYPAVMGRDYTVADLTGRGTYIGTVLSVTAAQDGWFGEGDEYFYIDGEAVPSLQGTGTEDYFNDAWGFRSRTSAWFGQPRWSGYRAGEGGPCYRWHVLDPVYFSRSLKVTLEHKGNMMRSEDGWYFERPDFLSSVAFWYQQVGRSHFDSLPSYPERSVPWISLPLVSLFRSRETVHGTLEVGCEGMFGGRPALRFVPDSGDEGGDIESSNESPLFRVAFSVAETGTYTGRIRVFSEASRGRYRVMIDDERASDIDVTGSDLEEIEVNLGSRELEAGAHSLAFVAQSRDRNDSIVVELLELLKLPRPGGREPRNFNEAHFIGLAIGRAVYAYRLAFGRLPGDLGELVDSRILESRFLADENGYSLSSRIEGERFVVESTGPETWRREWRGLDARR